MSQRCEKCSMRARYDRKPRSILARIWRWHINWCPGWKSYMKSLPEPEQADIIVQYDLSADKWKTTSG